MLADINYTHFIFLIAGAAIGFFFCIIAFSKKDSSNQPNTAVEEEEEMEFEDFAAFAEYARNMPIGNTVSYDGSSLEGYYFIAARVSGWHLLTTETTSSTGMSTVFIETGKF